MRIRNGMIGMLAGLTALMAASAASAALTVVVTPSSNPAAVPLGGSITLDIVVTTTAPEALALGLRAANYDPAILGFDDSTIPASIFNFSPEVQFGGLGNNASGLEQPPQTGVRAGTSVNLFQGVSTTPAAGAGPDSFSVTFTGDAEGTTTVDVGAFANYSDVYLGGNNLQTTDSVTITVVPEPTSIAAALAAMGSVLGVVAVRRR